MQESFGPVSDRTQPARYRSSTDVPGNIVQNQPGSDLVLADCVTFCPNGSGPEAKPMCKNHLARFWPVLPSQSGSDANRIQHVYWDAYWLLRTVMVTDILNHVHRLLRAVTVTDVHVHCLLRVPAVTVTMSITMFIACSVLSRFYVNNHVHSLLRAVTVTMSITMFIACSVL